MSARAENKNKLTPNERIISPETWEALNELLDECARRDISFIFSFDTGRYSEYGSEEVIQGPQGFTLEIEMKAYNLEGKQKLYRTLEELVADGWRILGTIATQQHIEDTEI